MTDPADGKKPWPTGLKAFLDSIGAKSLVDAIKKKLPKEPSKIRKAYIDPDDEPDL